MLTPTPAPFSFLPFPYRRVLQLNLQLHDRGRRRIFLRDLGPISTSSLALQLVRPSVLLRTFSPLSEPD
jgi:hypothetical protein